MNCSRLQKIKLRLTPRRVAVQYLDWAHSFPRTKEPCPLADLFKQMETEIDSSRYIGQAGQIKMDSKPEVYFLVELYIVAFTELIDNASASLHLHSFAEAYLIRPPVSRPEFYKRFVEQCNALSVSLAAIEQIQSDYLRKPVMLRKLTDFLISIPIYSQSQSLLLLGPRAVSREAESGISERFLETHEVAEQARGKVRDLVAIARKTACLNSCNRAAISLLQPFAMLIKHSNDFELCCLAVDRAK
jgi:hypothetical protein